MKTRKKKSGTAPPNLLMSRSIQMFKDYGKHLGISEAEIEAITKFKSLSEPNRIAESRSIIQQTVINITRAPDSLVPEAIRESESLLKGYATLDDAHRAEIKKLIVEIGDYLKDTTRRRPLNCLMLATPGAGKSHFIKQIATKMSSATSDFASIISHDAENPGAQQPRAVVCSKFASRLLRDGRRSEPRHLGCYEEKSYFSARQ